MRVESGPQEEILKPKKTAFIFPGQGSQEVGMGRDLNIESGAARRVFKQANDALGIDISGIMFNGNENQLRATEIAQPAIMTVSIATLKALEEKFGDKTPKPDLTGGHSLGLWTSLVAAGVVDFENGVKLVRERGRLMDEASKKNPGSMAALIGIDEVTLEEVCRETGAYIANVNSSDQIIISGSNDIIARTMDLASARGARKAIRLNVDGAFHSELMEPAREGLKAAISSIDFKPPQIPIVANSNGEILTGVDAIKRELINSLCEPVLWKQMVALMRKQGVNFFLEFGPGSVLTGLVKRIDKSVQTFNIDSPDSIQKLANAMAV